MAETNKSQMKKRNKIENPGKLFLRLLRYIGKRYFIQLIAVLILILAGVLANVKGTLFLKSLIDDYIMPLIGKKDPDFSGLLQAILTVSIYYGIGVVSTYLYSLIMVYVGQGVLRTMRDDLFAGMEKLPIRYFDTHAHGSIMSSYTNDVDTLRQMIGQSLPQLLSSMITVVSVAVSMLFLSIPLFAVTILFVVLMLVSTKSLAGMSGSYFMEQQKQLGTLNGYIEEMMEGQKVVKVFCHEEESIQSFQKLNEELFDASCKANKFANILMPIIVQMGNVSYVACAIVGGVLVLNGFGGLTVGALASFLSFNKSFNMPISQISQQLNAVVMALAGADRIFRMMDEQPEIDEGSVSLVNTIMDDEIIRESDSRTGQWSWKITDPNSKKTDYIPLTGDVIFEDVDFGYSDEKMVLKQIQLYANAGQKIAFVGSTGAGKTTITNLINRFYDIQNGNISYDGIPIRDIRKNDLRRSLGIVLQDTHLFTETVMENIRFGRLDATDEEVIAAARLANADGFIRRLPEGYHTVLKGDGANLSQGQRQLLAIARAAVADPPVLILDEATSSIDTRTEKIVQSGMDRLMKGRTTFVIAHRLSTVKNSDCIVVLENGCIIEKGSHDQLLEEKGKYYQLYTGNQIAAS